MSVRQFGRDGEVSGRGADDDGVQPRARSSSDRSGRRWRQNAARCTSVYDSRRPSVLHTRREQC